VVSDELIEKYADSYLPIHMITDLINVNRNTLMRWAQNGMVRTERLDKIEKGKPYIFYHFGDCVVARTRRRRPRPFKNKMVNGIRIFQCNSCDTWKTKEGFYTDKRNELYGILSHCKDCHNEHSRNRNRIDEVKQGWRRRAKARQKKRTQDAKIATEWAENPTIPAAIVIREIDAVRPNCTDTEISNEARVHEDTIRNIRRKAARNGDMFLSTIDSIFTMLGEPEAFIRITEHLDENRPRWHRDYDYCQCCLRTKIPYMARGLCSTCYRHRNDTDYRPMLESPWSLKHAHCVKCYSTDSRHAAHGMCGRCYQQHRKAEALSSARV